MEGGANGATGLMGFGENSNGLCSMITMMHGMSPHHTHHHPHLTSNAEINCPFLPLPSSTTNNHDQNRNSSSGSSFVVEDRQNNSSWCYFIDSHNNAENNSSSDVKAKIMAHPYYHRLLAAYLDCQKVGAPPEVVVKLEEACASVASMGHAGTGCLGADPALDQFMEAYCEMLTKYEQELSKPFKEAMLFLQRIESQFKSLTVSSDSGSTLIRCCEGGERNGGSEEEEEEEEVDGNNNQGIDPQAEERELKGQLLRRYSGYLGSLKQEFMKKRKKGKLPKEARQQLLDWWSRHHKWPYPSESQKLALAESTGLDQKQINNWFINQRKRHWKPTEEMQYVVMDAAHPHPHSQYFMDSALGNHHPFPLDITPAFL